MKKKLIQYTIIGAGLIYLLSPIDLLPERMIRLWGFIDDVLVLTYLFFLYRRLTSDAKRVETQTAQNNAQHAEASARSAVQRPTPYEVLEITSDASVEEIQAAYRRRVAEYHPDKVNHLGEALQETAHEKMLEIQEAYEQLRRRRGF